WNAVFLESLFKDLAATVQIKPGELQLPFRIMLVGEKSGPPVFEIAALLGEKQTTERINKLLAITANW
ncbi:MAG TPA: glutamate--tRNA ligase, partial [Puia sp.]